MFRYRAIRKNSYQNPRWYLFQLKDCPALLWDDAFFLAGKTGTPIMKYDTIVRGHPTKNLFEGDIVLDKTTNEELGIIVYNNGFFIQKFGSDIRKSIPERHIYVSKGDNRSIEVLKSFVRTPISFKYLNVEFDLGDLVAVDGDALSLIVQSKPQKVNLNGVTELLYYDWAEKYKGYDGDIIKGKFVTLYNVTSMEE